MPDNCFQGFFVTRKIRDQHLYFYFLVFLSESGNGVSEMLGSSVRKIIPGDGCDDDIPQPQA